ncbi:type VI secretion system membrane subunit TssM [Paracoccus sp. KR1-242]|uniref:type VI secretion system membrane subunit TssM n=1 Tax=Paracoccus sp. KR1-242 TaxID=3410028 RepID=UPI003C0FCAF0
MRKVLAALGSSIGITVILTLVLSAVLWLLGPFFAFGEARPFVEVPGRLVGLAILWIASLLMVLVLLLRGQKRETKMAEEIVATADPEPLTDLGVEAELADLRDKLKQALSKLRRTKGGGRHLAVLPWYVIIGPPGTGKTTAIVNSGLNFPLAEEMGAGSIGGVGGTRNCDWWFTDGAVLIDTAGRYTTQKSDASADNAGWMGFLALLKKYRRRQPINGAIVAFGLSDLLMQDPVTQKANAAAIRRRLHELREKLGVRFPVYMMFTKADLIAGFSETYDRLPKELREQVWGFTLPLPQGKTQPSSSAAFDEEFDLLMARLNAHVLERMQSETDPQRRSLIAGFPGQLASVRRLARDFVTEVFQENRYEHAQLLRGVYFVSSTQEGTPIDRLMMGMARSFGIGRQAIGSGQGTGRSFFLTRLLDGVIFPEAGLVSADDKVERRYRWTRYAAITATVLSAVAVGILWHNLWQDNTRLREQVETQVEGYRAAAATIPPGPVADSDLPLVVPALEYLRTIPGAGVPLTRAGLGWGLDQSAVLGNEGRLAYRAALNRHFLPRLLVRLEDQMQSSINDQVALFDLLKVYLMLGQVGPMDRDMVEDLLAADWSRAYAGSSRDELRAVLAQHLDALLSAPMQKIDLNADLVAQVQDVLTRMPQAQRIYKGIMQTDMARQLPAWRPTDIGGPAIARAFVRSSGKPLNEGIEGIYTRRGFHEVFLPEALRVSAQIQRDAFVLGPAASQQLSQDALTALSRDILALYYNDYVARYDQMLSDLDIVPLQSLPHAVEVTNVLSGPASPIRHVLEAIAKETRLADVDDPTPAPADSKTGGEVAADVGAVAAALPVKVLPSGALSTLPAQSRKILDALSAPEVPGGEPVPQGSYVQKRFEAIQALVTAQDGAPSPVDTLIASLADLNQELNKLAFAGGAAKAENSAPAIQKLVQVASQLPVPIQRWVSQVVAGSSGIAADGTRASINAKWQAEVLPLCQQATTNKYPFSRRAAADISIQDFTSLFAPGALIDKFFSENLAEHVDRRSRPWTFRKVNDTDLGISPQVLLQMQHASDIRDAFFATGATPQVQFQITPEALDPQANAILLELDGTRVGFVQGQSQPAPAAITWPGAVGMGRVFMDPPRQGSENSIARDGPWALFRLLDAAEIRRTNVSDRTRVIFKVGGRIAIFGMQSGSVMNPFALAALGEFSCPASF